MFSGVLFRICEMIINLVAKGYLWSKRGDKGFSENALILTGSQKVAGSSPASSTKKKPSNKAVFLFLRF
jgi:hypothetical protein